jgi:predicted choloylglycine hydrolase
MKKITLSGSFYEIGQQYGQHFKKDIKKFCFMLRLMATIAEVEGRDFFRPKWYHFPAAFFKMKKYKQKHEKAASEFEANILKYYPEMLDMIKGISDSTGISYKNIIFMNCLLEYSMKCSAFGAVGTSTLEGKPLIGMNADESKFVQPYCVILNLKPKEGYEFTAVYMIGTIFPFFGMNETGLSFAYKALFLDNTSIKNVRMPFFLKMSVFHKCKNISEAKQIIDDIPESGSGVALYLADENQLLTHEESSLFKKTIIYDNGFHYTANFPQSKELQKYVKVDKLNDIVFFFAKNRHRRVGEFLQKNKGKLTEKLFHKILSDHGSAEDDSLNKSICVHPENSKGIKTCASIILSPRDKKIEIYEGNPCQNKKLEFSY